MNIGTEFYDFNGLPLWSTTDININIIGVYAISAGSIGSIPLPPELYNSNLSLRRRNNILPDEVANTGAVGDAQIVRNNGAISVSYNTVGRQSMVLEIHLR